jgi:peptidoglycan/LPS O-acetylase OafA/YrhL
MSNGRFELLDGLRGVAVTGVVFYHYLFFWTSAGDGYNLIAYDDAFAGVPFISVGYLGVHLFFAISGFVILLTLERTKSLSEFIIKRAIRLLPPLVLFGTITFAFVNLVGPVKLRVGWWEYLLSLIILPPQHIGMLIGKPDWQWIDGVYWSLWVEVKFYVIIGIMYFVSRTNLLVLWIGYELFSIILRLAQFIVGGGGLLAMAEGFFFQRYVPYFSLGLAAYTVWKGRDGRAVRTLVGVAVTHVAVLSTAQIVQSANILSWRNVEFVLGQATIIALLYALAWKRWNPVVFRRFPFVQVGRASYGIYLLHQNVGITILSLAIFESALLGLLGAFVVFVLVAAAASASFIWYEGPIQVFLKGRWLPRRPIQA